MATTELLLAGFLVAGLVQAATDVKVDFTLNTTDANGAPLQESRSYYIYRPDNLSKATPVPMILVMEYGGGGAQGGFLHRKADLAGFLVISCLIAGNSSAGTGWLADSPLLQGPEDYDYVNEVINRVRASDNAAETFIIGLSKGGHMSIAYACDRPSTLTGAGSVDEFMQLPTNIPSGPVPVIFFQGTNDTNVPYTMTRDTFDAWRAVDGLVNAPPVTTYESAPRLVGQVSQATWRGGIGGTQAAFVTIIGGSHTYPSAGIETGYDCADGIWAFFSQFVADRGGAPKIVAQPVNNVQYLGQPATFWATASGTSVTYQWQKRGTDIPGANANWYTLPSAAAADNGADFRVVVTNDAGSVISSAATLKVVPMTAGPNFTTQPADLTVASGEPVQFSVAATGSNALSYQWKKNGVILAGATSDTLLIPAAITSDSGASFTVAVTDSTGTTTSNRATLTVNRPPGVPVILQNPARFRTVPGRAATFSIRAWSLSPMTYQWQKGIGTGNMADIPGATDATYIVPSPTLADHLTLFRCVVTNDAGNAISADEMIFVTAVPVKPTVFSSPSAVTAQLGAPFQFALTQNGATLPVTYSAAPLPAGLSLDPDSGIISGIPSDAGVTRVAIQVSNSVGVASAILNLTVSLDPLPLMIEDWRRANFGASATDPVIAGDDADPDGDGVSNLQEFLAGTNPLDSLSSPSAN